MEKTAAHISMFVVKEETSKDVLLVRNPQDKSHDFWQRLHDMGMTLNLTKIRVNKILTGRQDEICLWHMSRVIRYDKSGIEFVEAGEPKLTETCMLFTAASSKYNDAFWRTWICLVIQFAKEAGVEIQNTVR